MISLIQKIYRRGHAGATAPGSIPSGVLYILAPREKGRKKKMNLSKRELELISNSILFQMEKMSESQKHFVDFPDATEEIKKSIFELWGLNSKICAEMKE